MNKSSIFVWGISFFLLGSFLGVSKQTGIILPLILFVFGLFCSFKIKERRLKISAIFLVFFLLGFLKAEVSSWEESKYSKYYGQKAFFKATIAKDPETYKQKFKRITLKPEGFDQMLLTTFFTRDQYFYGDHVFVSGKIKEPRSDDDFNYKRYLQSKNIHE